MRRSPLKRKPKQPKNGDTTSRTYSTLKRKPKAPKSPKETKSYGRLNSAGKKTNEWAAIREALKQDFISKGILYCEIQFDSNCQKGIDGFAHTLKRRNMGRWGSDERKANLESVVAACNYCHDKVEMQGEEKMKTYLSEIIENRKKKLAKWKKIS